MMRSSLVALMVKNFTALWETWVWSLVGKVPWRRECYPFQYSSLENSMGRGAWWAKVHGVTKSDMTEWLAPLMMTAQWTGSLWKWKKWYRCENSWRKDWKELMTTWIGEWQKKMQVKELRSLNFNGEDKWRMKYMSIKGEIRRRSQFWGESDNFISL